MARNVKESEEELVKKAVTIKHQYEKDWMSVLGVSAIGVGFVENGKVGIIISIAVKPEEFTHHFPKQIDYIPIELRYSGTIKAK